MEQHQQPQSKEKQRKILFPLICFLGGILLGTLLSYTLLQKDTKPDVFVSSVRTIQFMLHDGNTTRSWANVTLNEGESVADTLDRIGRVDGLTITWSGNGKERELETVNESSGRKWQYYINGSTPLPSIGKYYPKDKDVVAIIKQN